MNQLRSRIERNRARQILESVNAWYSTCKNVTTICGDALHDEAVLHGDIGEVIDRADRQLFQFRSHTGEARTAVKRQDQILAKRIDKLADDIYDLRNHTARFLIRGQGPGPFAGGEHQDEQQRQVYYQKALQEAGFQAREKKKAVDQELSSIWNEIQGILRRAEEIAAG